MKLSKYIIAAILIVAVMIFIGEMHIWDIGNFEEQYSEVTFYPSKTIKNEEFSNDFNKTAEKNNVVVFHAVHNIKSYNDEEIEIYGTRGTARILKKHNDIKEGLYSSLLGGNIRVRIHSISEIADKERANNFCIYGKTSNMKKFKQALVGKYGGGFPHPGTGADETKTNIISLWVAVLVLLLLLTLYQVLLMKKEMIIRLTSGESLSSCVLKCICQDAIVIIGVTGLSMLLLGRNTNVTYHISISIVCLIVYLIINSALYTILLFTDYKKDISGVHSGSGIMVANYLYKSASTVLLVIMLAGCISTVFDGLNYYNQREFYSGHRDDSYIMISTQAEDGTDEKLQNDLFLEYTQKDNLATLIDISYDDNSTPGYIYACGNIEGYLNTCIPEIKDKLTGNKTYVIQPRRYNADTEIKSICEDLCQTYTSNKENEIAFLYYDKKSKLISQSCDDGIDSTIVNNPIIIFEKKTGQAVDSYIWQGCMLKISGNEWKTFVKENDLEGETTVYRTNVYENYLSNWEKAKKKLFLSSVLLFILLIIESIIIYSTLLYEYKFNAVELILRKITGHSVYSRYRRIIKTTVGSCTAGILIAIAISLYNGMGSVKYIILAGIAILALEMIAIIRVILKTESVKTQNVLKGNI